MNTFLKVVSILLFSYLLNFLSAKNESTLPTYLYEVAAEKSKGELIIAEAKKYIGTKYRYGGKSPKGFDCSGFTQFIFKKEKITLVRSAREQAKQGRKIALKKATKGDLLFFGGDKLITHVGIIVSEKEEPLTIIHASTSQGIVTTIVEESKYWHPKMKYAKRHF